MPRENLVFMIVTPLALMVVIAIGVTGIGEALLFTHDWAHHALHVDDYADPAQKHHAEDLAKLYPVAVALVIGAIALVGGSIASRLAGAPPQSSTSTTHH